MTADRWFVLVAGLALIDFIVWFFWLKRSTGARAAEVSGGYQVAMILVKGGYTPDSIMVPAYPPLSAGFSSLYGIGGVRVAAQPSRGIMAARS